VSVVRLTAEIVFGGAVLLAPWGFLVGFVAGLIEKRNPGAAVGTGGRWALAVAVIPALVLGLIVISLIMLPLWFIPVLGWAACFRVIAAYMRPWERWYRSLGISLRWSLRMVPGTSHPSAAQDAADQMRDFAEDQVQDAAERYIDRESGSEGA